jgi:ABC-type multidrug transport system fused ATPase/permease subunit
VDPRTELLIYQELFHEFRDKVMVSSLHRLHLLRHFHYIYLLEQGKVVAEGSLQELLQNSALFRSLWQHQEGAKPGQE